MPEYSLLIKLTYLLEKQAETAQSDVSWVFHTPGVAKSGSIMLTLAITDARHARDYIAPSLLSHRRKATACQQRSLVRERSVARGSDLVSGCILRETAIRGDGKIFETSRCTNHNAPLLIRSKYIDHIQRYCTCRSYSQPGSNNGQATTVAWRRWAN